MTLAPAYLPALERLQSIHSRARWEAEEIEAVREIEKAAPASTAPLRFWAAHYRERGNPEKAAGFLRQAGKARTEPTVEEPLDDAAFIYWVRMLPLEVGRTYRFERYYKARRNPIIVEVLGREVQELPGGRKVECLVLHPVIGSGNLMREKNDARIWLTDDERRIPVRIRTKQPFGTIALELREMTLHDASSR